MGRRATTIENAKTVASLPLRSDAVGDDVVPSIDGYELERELGRAAWAWSTKRCRPGAADRWPSR